MGLCKTSDTYFLLLFYAQRLPGLYDRKKIVAHFLYIISYIYITYFVSEIIASNVFVTRQLVHKLKQQRIKKMNTSLILYTC